MPSLEISPSPEDQDPICAAVAELDRSREDLLGAGAAYFRRPHERTQNIFLESSETNAGAIINLVGAVLDNDDPSETKATILVTTLQHEGSSRTKGLAEITNASEIFADIDNNGLDKLIKIVQDMLDDTELDANKIRTVISKQFLQFLEADINRFIGLAGNTDQARRIRVAHATARVLGEIAKITAGVAGGLIIHGAVRKHLPRTLQ